MYHQQHIVSATYPLKKFLSTTTNTKIKSITREKKRLPQSNSKNVKFMVTDTSLMLAEISFRKQFTILSFLKCVQDKKITRFEYDTDMVLSQNM